MASKLGRVLIGAFASATLSTFALPFVSNATASTGTSAPRHDTQLVQYAQEEHHEFEEKTENKVDELKGDAAAVPDAVKEEHERHEANEAATEPNDPNDTLHQEEHHGLRHRAGEKAKRHVDGLGNEMKSAGNAAESEHETNEMNEKSDQ
jgi:hypothetical protein